MGCPEGQATQSGFIPNGLLPNEATSVTRVLDQDRWLRAEERTAELIAHIQPNLPSEEHRNAVASYVQRLIMKCFSCQVFTFGSVPLKTYLPDGDIDLTAFTNNQNFKDNWFYTVRDILKREEKSKDAEFHVKEVQYIQAEIGGLCTLCFLEEVDNLIRQNHIFKRSIILIKAWCYYESRILGAHHGLISTYALETLVLYIFRVYDNAFAGPLEVLHRFLEFFSRFDWDKYCLSLWGPVPISSLPNMRAEPPRKDCRELLLSKSFLNACNTFYAVMPGSQENQEQPFVSKYFNIVDPLRANNNLGRSVSKGNFFRIRRAFAFGAQRLVRLLDCPEENLIAEFDLFFRNTWARHGKSQRPDAPSYDLYAGNKNVENPACHEPEVEQAQASRQSHCAHQKHANNLKESKQMFVTSDVSSVSQTWSQKTNGILTGTMISDINHKSSMKKALLHDKGQIPSCSSNGFHAMRHFAREHSSPELAHISGEVPPQHNHSGVSGPEREQSYSSASPMIDNSKRSSSRSKVLDNHNDRASAENQQQTSYDWSCDDAVGSKNDSNNYNGEFGFGVIKEDGCSVDKAMQMHQEEQGFINITETFSNHSFRGYLQAPVNVNSNNVPFQVPPPCLASGYAPANSFAMLPVNVHPFESFWGHEIPYSQDLVPFTTLQWFPSVGVINQEEMTEPVDYNVVLAHLDHDDSDVDFWSEKDMNSVRGYECEDGNIQYQQQKDRHMVAKVSSGNSSGVTCSGSYSPKDNASSIEQRWLTREKYTDDSRDESTIFSDVNSTACSRYTPASRSTSRTKLSSSSFSNRSPSKASKLNMDQRMLKSAYPTPPSSVYESQGGGKLVDDISSQPDNDSGDWICQSTESTDLAESTTSETVTSGVRTHQSASYRQGPMTVSNSTVPDIPVLVGPGSGQRAVYNHHLFYPSGPPDLFFTMFPLYNLPTETGTPYTDTNSNCIDMDAEVGDCHACQPNVSLDSMERCKQSDTFQKSNYISNVSTLDSFLKQRSDILNGDFISYWQSLQYGRFCQNAQLQGSLPYPLSVVPPMYLQAQFPWDGPGRPSANMNTMAHGPPLVPMMPIRCGSESSDSYEGINQSNADGLPRYNGGTGPYLPNPVSYERYYYWTKQNSHNRYQKGNCNYERKDRHVERGGNWGFNSKPRFASRGQFHYQVERPGTRLDKIDLNNRRRHDRPWNSFKHGSFYAGVSQNGSFNTSTPNNHVASDMPFGIHPTPVTPTHFSGTNEASNQAKGSHGVVNELAKFERDSTDPDQPPSPNF